MGAGPFPLVGTVGRYTNAILAWKASQSNALICGKSLSSWNLHESEDILHKLIHDKARMLRSGPQRILLRSTKHHEWFGLSGRNSFLHASQDTVYMYSIYVWCSCKYRQNNNECNIGLVNLGQTLFDDIIFFVGSVKHILVKFSRWFDRQGPPPSVPFAVIR